MTTEAHPSLTTGTSGGSVMTNRAGDQVQNISLPEAQTGLKGGSQWHESVSSARARDLQTCRTTTTTISGIADGYVGNTSTNLQHQQISITVKPTTMPYRADNGENTLISSELANQLNYQGGWTNVYLHQLRVAHLLLSKLLKLVVHMLGINV